MKQNERAKRKTIAIAGGKGGVGKSVLASNLARILGAISGDAVAVDLDLGGSNLHTYLGIRNTNAGIGNFLADRRLPFAKLIAHTQYQGLRFVPGDVLVSGVADVAAAQRKRICEAVEAIEATYTIIDLGSGSNAGVVDFFRIANGGVVVTTPQPQAVLNAFGFLKNVAFATITEVAQGNRRATTLLNKVMHDKVPGSTPPLSYVLEEVRDIDRRLAAKMQKAIDAVKPQLIVNMMRTPGEFDSVRNLGQLIKTNLGIELSCLGAVFFDDQVNDASSERTPITQKAPSSLIGRQLVRIAEKIAQSPNYPDLPLATDEYEDSFALAEIEIEADQAEIDAAMDEDHDASGEWVSLLAQHKRKIDELEGTVRMLTFKNTGQMETQE